MKHFFENKKRLLSMVVVFTMILSLCTGAGAPAQVKAEDSITITTQPKDVTVTEGSTGSLTVAATTTATGGALMFQWYSCDDTNRTGAEKEEGANTDTFAIPANLAGGREYYYYCEVGAEGVAAVKTNVATVTVENAVANVAETGDGSCNHEEGLVFNNLDTSDTVTISENATYYLTGDYEFVKRPIVINSGCTVVICTNGYNISNSESYNNTYLFKVSTGAKLIIKNCNAAEKESEITASFGESVARSDTILCGGILEVYNVTLKNVTGGTRPRVIGIDGQNAGEIYLYDSTIASLLVGISNVNDELKYGTVTAENCKFEMTDPMDPNYWYGLRSLDKVVLKNCTVTGDIIADNVQCVVFENCELNCNDFENTTYAAIGIKNNSCEEESIIKNCTLTAPNLTAISYVTNGSVDGLILLENSTINAKEGIKLFEAGSAKLYCTIKGKTPLTVEKAHMLFEGDVVLDMEEAELQQSEMKVALRWEDDLPQSVDSPVLLALCPSDYASYFTAYNAGVYVYSEPNEEMYNLYLGKPGFAQQPTSENPKVEVNLAKNVSYQWYSAEETETFIDDTNTINGDAGIDNYAGNNKWDGFDYGEAYVYFGAVGSFKAGDKLVIEWDEDDAVSGQFKIAIDDYEDFPITEEDSSLTYDVSSMTESLMVMFVLGEEYDAPPTVTAKIIGNEIADPVEGQNSNTLKQGSKGKTYACVATWNKDSELEFSATSDFVTLAEDIENTPTTATIADLKDLVVWDETAKTITLNLDSSKEYMYSYYTYETYANYGPTYDAEWFNTTFLNVESTSNGYKAKTVLPKDELNGTTIEGFYKNLPAYADKIFARETPSGVIKSDEPIVLNVETGACLQLVEVRSEDAFNYTDEECLTSEHSGNYYIMYGVHALLIPAEDVEPEEPAGFTLTMTNKDDYRPGAVYISKETGLTAGDLVTIDIYAPEGYKYTSDMREEIKNSIKLDGARLLDLFISSNRVRIELYGFTKDATIEIKAEPKQILEIYIDFNTYLSEEDKQGPNWTWAGATHTLTLNGVTIETEDGYNAIQVPYGTTIVLAEGTRNVISGYSHGFYIDEGLAESLYVKITGTGTLEIENCSTGIYVSDGNLIFEQGTVIVDSNINVQKVAGGSNPQNSITFTPDAKVKVLGEIYNCPIKADDCTITGAVFKDADGNEYTEYVDGIWKMVQAEEGKPILINFPETPPAEDTCDHDWEVIRDENDHYKKCIECEQEVDRAAHTFTNNVCSICGYEKVVTPPTEKTYTITLDRTNYADGYVELYTYDSKGSNVAATQENNDTITMPEGGSVKIFAGLEFTVTAEGATISKMLTAGEEGYYYEITGITADTTVVVNKGVTPEPETHEHVWSEAWVTTDASYHWHECVGTVGTCDITANANKGGYGLHVYSNDYDTTCDTCGHVRTVSTGGGSTGGNTGGGGGSYYPPYVPVVTPTPVPTVAPTPTVTPVPTATPAPTEVPVPTATPIPGVVTLPTMEETIVDKSGEEVTNLVQDAGTTNKLEITGVTDQPGAVVSFESSNTNAVEVDEEGNVTMKNPGMSEITITVGEGEDAKQETIVVVVEEPPKYINEEEEAIKNVRLGTSWADIPLVRYQELGQTIDINFWGVKSWMKNKYDYVWETSDTSVAVTDNSGKVTALKPGVVTMSLGLKNKETGKMLNVKSIEVVIPEDNGEKILLGTSKENTFDNLTLKLDERVDINFYGVKNWKKNEYEYRWSSTEPTTVWVDEVGKITPVKPGNAIITLILIDKKTGYPKHVIPTTITILEKDVKKK